MDQLQSIVASADPALVDSTNAEWLCLHTLSTRHDRFGSI